MMYTTKTEAQLAYPHYSNPIWNQAQCIYVKNGADKTKKIQHVDYSDRLWEWDQEAHRRGNEAAKQGTKYRSAKNVHLYLEAYHQCEVDLIMIYGGVNVSNGHEYYVYFYDLIEKNDAES